MANQDLVTQFKSLSMINKIGFGLAGVNAVGIVLVIAQVAGLAGIKSELQGAIYDSTDQFTTAIDIAVRDVSASLTSLECSGTYNGKLNISDSGAPTSFRFNGYMLGSSISGNMTSNSYPSLSFESDKESGTMSLSCK
jgi:hypothetical protein